MQSLLLLTLLALATPSFCGGGGLAIVDNPLPRCVPITHAMCMNVGYNYTVENPRLKEELSTGEIATDLQYWQSIEQSSCSKYLRHFVCAAYNPMCDPNQAHVGVVKPCRHVCEHVRKRCEALIKALILSSWPTRLVCEQFPATNAPNDFCMDLNIDDEVNKSLIQLSPGYAHEPASLVPQAVLTTTTELPVSASNELSKVLCAKTPRPEAFLYINRTDRCALLCNEHFLFTQEQKNIAQVWTVVLSSVCFVLTFFTVVTIAISIRQGRYRFPERPVVFLAACYCAMSAAYLIRFAVGRDSVSCATDATTRTKYLAAEGLENFWCGLVFLTSYFFGLAGATWWCLLTVSLALATAWRRAHEGMQRFASYFYIVGLGAPAAVTTVVLVLRWVDADELLGTCSVGNQNPTALLYFVIVPHCVVLLVGLAFLVVSFVAQIRAKKRSAESRDGSSVTGGKQDKLETSMVKIGLYSVIGFILPSTCVVACNIYEYVNYDEWQRSPKARPAIEIYMLRLFMLFTMGITTVMFVWSRKTIDAWREPFARLCCQMHVYEKPAIQTNVNGAGAARPGVPRTHGPRAAQGSVDGAKRSTLVSGCTVVCPPGRFDYELVQQEEKAARCGNSTAYLPSGFLVNNNCTSAKSAAIGTKQPGVHSLAHSSSGVNTNAGSNSASQQDFASVPSAARARQLTAFLQVEYANINQQMYVTEAPFYGAEYPTDEYGSVQVASDSQMQMQAGGQYHAAVHQGHLLARGAPDELANGGSYHYGNENGNLGNEWSQQAVMSNVVAPPPSLVNAHVSNNGTYYMQQAPMMTDSRRFVQPAFAFPAYKKAKNETVF